MPEMISMSSPDIDDKDVEAVVEVLRSGRLSLGPKTEAFEEAIAQYIGVRHAVAVSSGTAALHLIVRALGLAPGDEVLVPSFTFAASINVLLYENVIPVFCDIEDITYNVDPSRLEERITSKTRAILAVDVFGHPAEWGSISSIAAKHNLRVIDDSCEALGAEYAGHKIGQFGDAAAFAFYPNKQITTGEGGVLVTNNSEIALTARSLRNQGRGEMGSWLEHERLDSRRGDCSPQPDDEDIGRRVEERPLAEPQRFKNRRSPHRYSGQRMIQNGHSRLLRNRGT